MRRIVPSTHSSCATQDILPCRRCVSAQGFEGQRASCDEAVSERRVSPCGKRGHQHERLLLLHSKAFILLSSGVIWPAGWKIRGFCASVDKLFDGILQQARKALLLSDPSAKSRGENWCVHVCASERRLDSPGWRSSPMPPRTPHGPLISTSNL